MSVRDGFGVEVGLGVGVGTNQEVVAVGDGIGLATGSGGLLFRHATKLKQIIASKIFFLIGICVSLISFPLFCFSNCIFLYCLS